MTKIKNYTSSVPADRSIMQIEKALIGMGASRIAKEYTPKGDVVAISFSIRHGESDIPFMLPAKKDPIKKLLLQQYRRPTLAQTKQCTEQAERTAWRNVKEWVELQATMIKLEQVEFMEVFMSYMLLLQEGKTLYESMKEGGFKQLTA